MAHFEHKEKFLDFKMKSDYIDVFKMDLSSEKSHAYLLVVTWSRLSVLHLMGRVLQKEVSQSIKK